MEMRQSNYEIMRDRMSEQFLAYDQEQMIEKFALEQDDRYLYITFFGRNYRINRMTGETAWSDDGFRSETKADFNEAMTIYDVLCNSKKDCRPTGEWTNINSLSSIKNGSLQSDSSIFTGSARYFDGKIEGLRYACGSLGGKPLDKGDAAYEIQMFPFLSVVLRYWESDEDFPPSMQILVDRQILDFVHFETLMFALSHLFSLLKMLCDEHETGKE